jgi:hypothetical protein
MAKPTQKQDKKTVKSAVLYTCTAPNGDRLTIGQVVELCVSDYETLNKMGYVNNSPEQIAYFESN